MSGASENPCFFCAMPGAQARLSHPDIPPTDLYQGQCGTVQTLHGLTGEILATRRSAACHRIAALQAQLEVR